MEYGGQLHVLFITIPTGTRVGYLVSLLTTNYLVWFIIYISIYSTGTSMKSTNATEDIHIQENVQNDIAIYCYSKNKYLRNDDILYLKCSNVSYTILVHVFISMNWVTD